MRRRANQITLEGKIVSDIRRSESKSGVPVANFRLMHKQPSIRNHQTLFVDIEVWREEAIRIGTEAERGSIVTALGELRMDEWTNKEGEKRSKLKVVAEKIVVEKSPQESYV